MVFIWNGQDCEVNIYRTVYSDGSLYIYLTDESDRFFLSLSSNIYYSKDLVGSICAYVNLHTLPDADRFIVKYRLGKSEGSYRRVGIIKYGLYSFDLEKIEERDLHIR